MELCGNIGHSSVVAFYADGDGDFRPKFEFDKEYKKTNGYWSKDGKEYIWTATPQARRNHRLEDEARQEYLKYDQRFRVAQMAESIAREKYIKTKLSSIPRRTIAKGAAIVANFLSKYSK